MAQLMISVSGIRGIVGEGLTPEVIIEFAQAYGAFCQGKPVVIGRDSRVSGDLVHHAFVSGLLSVGNDVIDIGIASTPTTQMMTEKLDCGGGIIITASHNPVEWNGIKMLASDGLFLDAEQGAKVLEIRDNKMYTFKTWQGLGTLRKYETASEEHVQATLELPYINVEQIRERKFKVVADLINGAGCVIVPNLLEAFGCEMVLMNDEPHGRFARTPEPLPENLTAVGEMVKKHGADLAVVVDPDSDRLALVDEKGVPLGEEYTLGVSGEYFLTKKQGKLVVNVSTSQLLGDLAKKYNCELEYTKVGEINVTKHMREIGAVFGGEGNGGVIVPDFHLGRDAIIGIALVLQRLAMGSEKLSEIRANLPQYFMVKQKIQLGFDNKPGDVIEKIKEKYAGENLDLKDGLKIWRDNSWVQVRASNTEPILRVMAEAPTQQAADALADELRETTQKILQG